MASLIGSFASPFRNTYRSLHRAAHEQPVLLWSLIIGALGPVALVAVPPIRRRLGYKSTPPAPSSYPLPQRARREVKGYDDE
ncbi:hypothetical protein SISNIDRAFT_417999 [Sistotremastrum niveocremeum HHB9708]|uniref:NADH-ubiquinone oxidoreductase 9.5 kDa subunit n=2 Tax=Sistotremastraceae TaxID=3402574 RepID=A0A164PAQ7_9AGAM|nr:hypothetical protein SISNIDRAFT_417999 [Sistotremastrum niveocremeum HHB9708]KZT32831.1 hypothetical protein SISSUDRAFT_993705 [Sistotremastrum suecicum HHB10207 ss-3]